MNLRSKQFLLIPAMGLWFAASAGPLAWFGAVHLRRVNLATTVPASFTAVNPAGPRWRMIHLLVEGCGCSEAIAGHLCDRRPMKDVDEVVYVVAGNHHFDWVKKLNRDGFDVRVQTADEVRLALGSDAGPQLLIEDPTGAIRYRGGYQSTRPGTRLNDASVIHPGLNHPAAGLETDTPQESEILCALRQGRDVDVYPAFGCAGALNLP